MSYVMDIKKSIGLELVWLLPHPALLRFALGHVVKNLSAELYAKNVHLIK